MFTYKNKVTGAVIQTHGKVSGPNWVQVKDNKAKNAKADQEKEPDKA